MGTQMISPAPGAGVPRMASVGLPPYRPPSEANLGRIRTAALANREKRPCRFDSAPIRNSREASAPSGFLSGVVSRLDRIARHRTSSKTQLVPPIRIRLSRSIISARIYRAAASAAGRLRC